MAACPSLDELLEGVSRGKLGRPCTDAHLCKIALRVTSWELIAPFLDLSQAEIEAIYTPSNKENSPRNECNVTPQVTRKIVHAM